MEGHEEKGEHLSEKITKRGVRLLSTLIARNARRGVGCTTSRKKSVAEQNGEVPREIVKRHQTRSHMDHGKRSPLGASTPAGLNGQGPGHQERVSQGREIREE